MNLVVPATRGDGPLRYVASLVRRSSVQPGARRAALTRAAVSSGRVLPTNRPDAVVVGASERRTRPAWVRSSLS